MILTDKKALKYLAECNSVYLEECIQELQKDDRTDLEVLYDELCWDLEQYECDGFGLHEDLVEFQKFLRGLKTGKGVYGFWTSREIKEREAFVAEYKRIKKVCNKVELALRIQ